MCGRRVTNDDRRFMRNVYMAWVFAGLGFLCLCGARLLAIIALGVD